MALKLNLVKMLKVDSSTACPACFEDIPTCFETYNFDIITANWTYGKFELEVKCPHCGEEFALAYVVTSTPVVPE